MVGIMGYYPCNAQAFRGISYVVFLLCYVKLDALVTMLLSPMLIACFMVMSFLLMTYVIVYYNNSI